MTKVYYANELYHHGIEGQKWGVRRYQNEDGSLTEEGKKRYNKLVKRETKTYEKSLDYAMKKGADTRYDKAKKELDYEEQNGGSTAKTRYKYNVAKIQKEGYDKIDEYARKTIKEIDPDNYNSNAGKSAVKSMGITVLATAALGLLGGGAAVFAVKGPSDTQKKIQEYTSLEQRRMDEKVKKEKEKYKSGKY